MNNTSHCHHLYTSIPFPFECAVHLGMECIMQSRSRTRSLRSSDNMTNVASCGPKESAGSKKRALTFRADVG